MIDKLQSVTRALCNNDVIEMDLTAGLDSRAILGIALAISDASRVKAHVRGEDGSVDVSVAKRISRKYKFDCESAAPPPPTPETFLEHARLLAFFSNGDSDSKRAVHALPYMKDRNRLYLKGGGGEIFRGYYYGSKSWQDLTALSPAQAVETILHKYPRIGNLPWPTPEFPKQVRTRIKTIINGYHSLGARGADLLDLFYLFERFGRWAALDARGTWFERHYSPFAAPELVAMGFKLPAPLGNAARLHQRIIQRHLPALYFWPINGKEYLTLLDRKSAARRYGRYACRAVDLGLQALKKWTATNGSYKTQDQIRAEIFAGHFGEIIRDVLMVEQSFGLRVFGRQNMTKLLDEHRDGTANHLEVLGLLVTMEQWRLLVEQANGLSKQDARDGERFFLPSDVVGIGR
jgi:hypothetical protein